MRKVFFAAIALVVYTFAGYPALLAAWARIRTRPIVRDGTYRPRVSLIVPAYNEAGVIVEKLRNCRELEYPANLVEVIVVADGSTDETAALAEAEPGTRVLH